MRRIPMIIALQVALALPALAVAEGQAPSSGQRTPQPPPAATRPHASSGAARPAPEPAEPEPETGEPAARLDVHGFRARHDVRGEVTSMNKDSGMVTLKTPDGDMRLQFPPSALGGIDEGDHVEIELAIKPAPAPTNQR